MIKKIAKTSNKDKKYSDPAWELIDQKLMETKIVKEVIDNQILQTRLRLQPFIN